MTPKPQRSTHNRNHHLHYAPIYIPEPGVQLPILTYKGPAVREYLDRTYRVFKQAQHAHSRILVSCFTLTMPHDTSLPEDLISNDPIRRFIRSFESKVAADMKRKRSPHRSSVRYVIAREISQDGMPHYHIVLLLNGHAYRTIGTFDCEQNNVFWMVTGAWASALGLSDEEAVDGVQVAGGHQVRKGRSYYYLSRDNDYADLPEAFQRASYLCKAATKQFGQRYKGLLTSQK